MIFAVRHFVFATLFTTSIAWFVGCGATRSTDTNRTATEQLLVSDAIDRAVQSVNVQSLTGQSVFLDDSRLGEVVDRNYLVSTLRQHLLATGCMLRDKREDADFIVEARAGAVGTDRNDLLFGVPSMNVPQIPLVQPVPAAIPEIPFAKRRDQRGIAKIAVFAYHRETGMPVWQSGIAQEQSSSNDVWILGAGPFQRGTIHEGTSFAGKQLRSDESEGSPNSPTPKRLPAVDLAHESTFTPPNRLAKLVAPPNETGKPVVQAAHQEPQTAPAAPTAPVAATPPPASASTAPQTSPTPPSVVVATPPPDPATMAPVVQHEPRSIYTPPAASPLPQPRFDSRD